MKIAGKVGGGGGGGGSFNPLSPGDLGTVTPSPQIDSVDLSSAGTATLNVAAATIVLAGSLVGAGFGATAAGSDGVIDGVDQLDPSGVDVPNQSGAGTQAAQYGVITTPTTAGATSALLIFTGDQLVPGMRFAIECASGYPIAVQSTDYPSWSPTLTDGHTYLVVVGALDVAMLDLTALSAMDGLSPAGGLLYVGADGTVTAASNASWDDGAATFTFPFGGNINGVSQIVSRSTVFRLGNDNTGNLGVITYDAAGGIHSVADPAADGDADTQGARNAAIAAAIAGGVADVPLDASHAHAYRMAESFAATQTFSDTGHVGGAPLEQLGAAGLDTFVSPIASLAQANGPTIKTNAGGFQAAVAWTFGPTEGATIEGVFKFSTMTGATATVLAAAFKDENNCMTLVQFPNGVAAQHNHSDAAGGGFVQTAIVGVPFGSAVHLAAEWTRGNQINLRVNGAIVASVAAMGTPGDIAGVGLGIAVSPFSGFGSPAFRLQAQRLRFANSILSDAYFDACAQAATAIP